MEPYDRNGSLKLSPQGRDDLTSDENFGSWLPSPAFWFVGSAVLTLMAALVGLRLQTDGIAVFWPAAGIAAGMILITSGADRAAAAAGILAALAIGNWTDGRDLATSLVFMTGNLVQAMLVTWLLERLRQPPFRLDSLGHVLAFLGTAIAVPAFVGLFTGPALMWTVHSRGTFSDVWWIWTTSHAVGIATIAPAVLQLPILWRASLGDDAENVVLTAAIAIVAAVLIGAVVPETSPATLVALIMTIPIVWWVALRANAMRVALALLAVSVVTVWTAGRTGLFAYSPAAAQGFLLAFAVLLLLLGARRGSEAASAAPPLSAAEIADQRAIVVLLPFVLFVAVAWWSWRQVETEAEWMVERKAYAIASQAERLFETQTVTLDAVLAHARGRQPGEISGAPDMKAFLAKLVSSSGSIAELTLVDVRSGQTLLSVSRGGEPAFDFAEDEVARSSAAPGIRIGDVVRSQAGVFGFTVSKRGETGLVAIAVVPVSALLNYYSLLREAPHDVLTVVRDDGTTLIVGRPNATPGLRLPDDSVFMRWRRGEVALPVQAPSAVDGRSRLWQLTPVSGVPVYALYGLDTSALTSTWLRQLGPFGLLTVLAAGALWALTTRLQRSAAQAAGARAEIKSKNELIEASKRLSVALDAATAGVWEWTVGAERGTWSPENFALFGLDPADGVPPLSQWIGKHVHPDDRARFEREFTARLDSGAEDFSIEYRVLNRDRGVRWISARGRIERDSGGKAARVVGLNLDITDRKRAENVIAERELQLRLALHASLAIVFEWDIPEDRVRRPISNAAVLSETAGSPERLDDYLRAVHPEDRSRFRAALDAALNSRDGLYRSEHRVVGADGKTYWLAESGRVEFGLDGRALRLIGISQDITDRKQAEMALRDSESRFRMLIDLMPVGVFTCDAEGRITLYNRQAELLWGQSPHLGDLQESFCRSLRLTLPSGEPLMAAESPFSRAAGTGASIRGEVVTIERPDGSRVTVAVNADPMRDPEGRVAGTINVFIDVTERIQSEQGLRERLAEIEALYANAPVGLALLDRNLRFIRINKMLADINGVPVVDHLGRSAWDIVPALQAVVEPKLVEVLNFGREIETEIAGETPKAPGVTRYWHERYYPLRDAKGEIVAAGVAIDEITERYQAEAALRESEARFRTMADSAPVMIWVTEPDGSCSYLSKSWYEVTGQSPEAGPGHGWLSAIHPDDRERIERDFRDAHAQRQSVRFEYRLRRADGSYGWVINAASPRLDSSGAFRGLIGSVLDITDRKRAEEHVQLLMREVNHRSKNMLGLVQAIARMTAAATPSEFVERFEDRLLALSASQDLLVHSDWQPVPIEALITSQLEHFGDVLGARVTLEGPPVQIAASASQPLALALHELATNAAKYGALSSENGRVEIAWRIDAGGNREPEFTICWTEIGGPTVVEPARRGFGSTLIGSMLELNLHGEADLTFKPSGVVWRLTCPAAEVTGEVVELAALRPAHGEPRPSPGSGARRVLVVEDEALLAMETAAALADSGFEVVGPAGSVGEAFSLIEKRGCDVAVLDINLGSESAEPIAEKLARDGVPFIAVSGYARAQQPEVFKQVPFLSKPLRPERIIAEVRRCLEQVAAADWTG